MKNFRMSVEQTKEFLNATKGQGGNTNVSSMNYKCL